MKKLLFIMIAVALCFSTVVKAEGEMGVTVDATYMTKYLWHGIDLNDDAAAFAPSINIDLGNGWYVGTMYVLPQGDGNAYGIIPRSDMDHWYYWAGFSNEVMVGEGLQMNYDLKYTYHDMGTFRPMGLKVSGRDADVQELALDVKMPNMCPMGFFTPHYKVSYLFDAPGGDLDLFGFEHTAGLAYNFTVADMVMDGCVDFVYDDNSYSGDSNWNRMVAGLSTQFEMAGGKLVPAIYYQKPFDDGSTGPLIDDDFYATLSYSFEF
ncbi:MAG: hypothetical protein ACIAQZ_10610 [Sedimentisphaeraceae bacterium JB056]